MIRMNLTFALLILLVPGSVAYSQDTAAGPACTPYPSPTPGPKDDGVPPGKKRDWRRLAPTVGTGGAVGGPTGLFTIYDGQTLRWKESTFSVSLSNFDRDPGNVDITDVPYSLQGGLSDNIEVFTTNIAYRGVRVNNPQNLSSFYLPNSSLPFGFRGPAIVLAPLNNQSVNGPLFRPPNNQPFVGFPFVGQPSGNFGNVTFSGTLGVQNTGFNLFGGASNFPGIGSAYGGILPGVVLSLTPTGLPSTFTLAPSYLPDAPFINHRYGQSTFTQTTIGLKIRLPFLSSEKTGVGLVPFYRFYRNGAGSASGFNQLQRGASPGASFGDVGVIGFASHRFTKYVNASANLGYIFNSNPRSSAFALTATLLDRPNEVTAGVGFDFPIKKYLQLIAEARSTIYSGGHTPNAFENNPVDFIGGARIFFSEGMGIGLSYRGHLNQQSGDRFNGSLPSGFVPSSNPHGFMAQFWFGRHFPRFRGNELEHHTSVDFNYTLTLACPQNQVPVGTCPACTACTGADTDQTPCLLADTFDGRYITIRALPDGATLPKVFEWHTEQGTPDVEGVGQKVRWDVSALPLNKTFTVRVEMADPDGKNPATKTFAITVVRCPNCRPIVCPSIEVTPSPVEVVDGSILTFNAALKTEAGVPYEGAVTYEWNINPGHIVGDKNASSITVDTSAVTASHGQPVKLIATVTIGGLNATCLKTAAAEASVLPPPDTFEPTACKLFDSYGAIKYNDEKARLDNLAIQLKEPGLQAYIVAYRGLTKPRIGDIGTNKIRVVGDICPEYRFDRALEYLVKDRGVDESRIHYIDGGNRDESSVDLWICPVDKVPTAMPDSGIVRTPGTCLRRGTPVIGKVGRKWKLLPRKKVRSVLKPNIRQMEGFNG